MFTKSKFSAAHQKSALYLEKQKTLKNSAKCALCSAKCALCVSVCLLYTSDAADE